MSQRYRSLFSAYVQNIGEDRKRPDVHALQNVAEQFEKNRADSHKTTYEKRELYYYETRKKQEERRKEQNTHTGRGTRREAHLEINTYDYYYVNHDKFLSKQRQTSKMQKMKSHLNEARALEGIKGRAEQGDQKATQHLEKIYQQAALYRLYGIKVRDDVSKIYKTIKNIQQQSYQKARKYEHYSKIKEVYRLVASGIPYYKAKKQILGAENNNKRY